MRYHLIFVLFIPLSLGCTQTETSAIQMVSVDSDLPPNQRDLGRTRGDVVDSRVPENPLPMDSAVVTDSTVPMDARDVFIELDGMTTRGDMGSQNSSMDAALIEDANVIPMGQCPMGAEVNACLFGMTSRQLLTREPLYVVLGPRHLDAVSLNALQQSQLIFGFECEGIFRPATAADALQMTDDGVQVLEIKRVNPIEYFTWFRFYMGDTEVGYIFRRGTLELVALVSDQDVQMCTEGLGDRPPMRCGQLAACLETCEVADQDCRRPCFVASRADAVEAYIPWEECASECGDNAACLDRVCASERADCFGP